MNAQGFWQRVSVTRSPKWFRKRREFSRYRMTTGVVRAQAHDDYENSRFKPTVPFVSILKDSPPSRFYTMQEEG